MNICRKFSRLLTLLLCCILVSGGCGKDGQDSKFYGSEAESDTEQLMAYKDIRYLSVFTDTSKEYDAFASSGIGFMDDTFYLIKMESTERNDGIISIGGGQLIACHPDTQEQKIMLDSTEMGAGIIAAAPVKGGSVIALLKNHDSEYILYKVDSEGNEIFSRSILFAEEPFNCRLVTDTQGRCYLITRTEIRLFDEKGDPSGTIDLSGKSINRTVCSNGTVYIYDYRTNQIIPVDFETSSLGTLSYSVPIMMMTLAASKEADFLICDETTVYQYSCKDGKLTPLFDLQDSQIRNASGIDTIGEMEDGRIFVFYNDRDTVTEMALLAPTPLAECPVKDVVTIGLISAGSSFLNSMSEFNRLNEEFNVSVINYRIGGRSYQEAQEALKLDLSIGKGPDLCDVTAFDEPETLFAGSCFSDLSPFLKESQLYKRGDFLEQALDIYTWQGQLLAIPNYFSLWTIAARPDIVGHTMGWSMEDMRAVIENHPDAVIFDEVPGSYVMTACFRNILDDYVDFENHTADFDSPGYIEFLDFISKLPDHYKEQDRQVYNEWLQEGKTLFARREIRGLADFQVMEADFGGEYTCIGYPSPDRTPDFIIRGWDAYAISAASVNKDRAWRFLEWYYSGQGNENTLGMIVRPGFPTRIDVYERELEEAMGEAGVEKLVGGMVSFRHNGASVNYRRATFEEAELLHSLIESARPEKGMEQAILGIIEEENAYLYNGSKTPEDVAAVIQNRVQLYLDERR